MNTAEKCELGVTMNNPMREAGDGAPVGATASESGVSTHAGSPIGATGASGPDVNSSQGTPRRIVTRCWQKPVPSNEYDWSAVDDNTYEPGCPIGFGATEQAAIDNLMEQLNDGT